MPQKNPPLKFPSFKTIAALCALTLPLAACATADPNMSNQAESSRVDAALSRAAREAQAAGQKADTINLLEQLYARNKKDPAIATSYAQALREDSRLNVARQVILPYTSANAEKPYPDAVTELSMIQLQLGQYRESELTARRALKMDNTQPRAYLALGSALDAQNKHEEAEHAFREGIDRWKGDPSPILNNLALNLASQNKLDQALAILEKARKASPGRIEIERNFRIISTLKESADDFLIKKEQEKKEKEAALKAQDTKKIEKTEEKNSGQAGQKSSDTSVDKEVDKEQASKTSKADETEKESAGE